ncbi:MAG: hypothetical protein K2W85_09275 [Phycisphaerales bacterium]|nr:hypothetical protein [Phycisphaerales bacterium]
MDRELSDTQVLAVLTSKDIKGLAQRVSDLSNQARQTKKSVPQSVVGGGGRGVGGGRWRMRGLGEWRMGEIQPSV